MRTGKHGIQLAKANGMREIAEILISAGAKE